MVFGTQSIYTVYHLVLCIVVVHCVNVGLDEFRIAASEGAMSDGSNSGRAGKVSSKNIR